MYNVLLNIEGPYHKIQDFFYYLSECYKSIVIHKNCVGWILLLDFNKK